MTDEIEATVKPSGELAPVGEYQHIRAIDPANQLIAMAMDKGMSAEVIEKLLDQKIRFEADEARKAFAAAMARCQKKMPAIQNNAMNDQTHSTYSKLEHINAGITPIYTAEGFSISFGEGKAEIPEMIRTVAKVMHRLGHFETYFYDLPADLSGIKGNVNKTAVHGKASTTSYGRRYLLLMIFNLTVGDDVDGNSLTTSPDLITAEEALTIEAYISDNDLGNDTLLREFRVKEWGQIKTKDFNKTKKRIGQILAKRSA